MIKRGAGRLVLSSTTNSYTGGTRLEGGSLQISALSNIGGSTAAITFAGGILRTSGTAITSLSTNNVNWATFDGGFDISTSGQSALCPRCGIDSVIGADSGYPITVEFLTRMKEHWF